MENLRLGFLASHGGSNMQAIMDAVKAGSLRAELAVVISNNSQSTALERAKKEGVDHYHISENAHLGDMDSDSAIVSILQKHEVNLVILAGYMKKIGPKTLSAFSGRILNIHPALLPNYGGQGMYGKNVHKAVLAAGEKESGVTVHVIDEKYDNGPILAQARVPVLEGDTADELADRVLKQEHIIYAATIEKIASGEIKLA